MFVLSEQQVSFILDDIKRNGIELEELQLNLLDHICCIIENEMEPGESFEEFYRKIIPRFFKRKLGEIQEETDLLLTFKHYYAMKKTMIISGAAAAIGIVTGSFFKVMHWPGTAVLFLLSVFIVSFIFLPILFLLKAKEIKVKREKTTLGLATLFGILASVATLFKVMHWPGANVMWLLSLGILFFLFLPIYFFGGIRNPETKVNTIVSSVLVLFAGGLLFLLTSLRPSQQLYHMIATSITQVDDSYSFATTQNALRYTKLPGDTTISQADLQQLKNTCDGLCAKIEALKNEIIDFASAGQDPKPTMEILVSNNAGNSDLPLQFLFDHNGAPTAKLSAIKANIEKLNALVSEKFHKENVSLLTSISINGNEQEKLSWENSKFRHAPFEMVMVNLNQLKLDVRLIEAGCLN
jgi:hypothetical protein